MQTSYDSAYGQDAQAAERAEFIRKTYLHLAGAILVFGILEYALLQIPWAVSLAQLMTGGYAWLIVLGAFMGVSYLAERMAWNATSIETQYAGLGLYVLAQAIIFLPMMLIAVNYSSPEVLPNAAMLTAALFTGLTFVVFTTKKDFSFLGSVLKIGGFVALGFIGASIVFGFSLGLLFSAAMVVFASVAILYNTSMVLREYPSDKYVAAALSLFASVALLFWYILQIFLSFGDD